VSPLRRAFDFAGNKTARQPTAHRNPNNGVSA
jgi:hypothetical protein